MYVYIYISCLYIHNVMCIYLYIYIMYKHTHKCHANPIPQV